MSKIKSAAMNDTITGLMAMDAMQRRALRAVAAGKITGAELAEVKHIGNPRELAQFISWLRECSAGKDDSVRLQPPYPGYRRCWRAGCERTGHWQ